MTNKIANVQETRYDLNSNQWIIVKKKQLEQTFKNLKFPILILDLEFFNRSHNIKRINNRWCDLTSGQSYVYLLQSAVYPNLQDLVTKDPKKMIKTVTLTRKKNEPNYSFINKYQKLINSFVDILIKNKIKNIVVAGASNDEAIINSWLKKRAKQLEAKEIKLEFLDVYPTLEQTMAFNNSTATGEIFWEPNNLKKGFSGTNTLSLPSLKKFFSYMTTVFPDFSYNDDSDIYQLSHDILEFFCHAKLTQTQFQKGMNSFEVAKEHCFNDVYKLITLLQYWIQLVFNENELKNFPRI